MVNFDKKLTLNTYPIITKSKFTYIDQGQGQPLVLLHGLMGDISNFVAVINHFSKTNRVIFPLLPLTEMSMFDATLPGLVRYTRKFIMTLKIQQYTLIGNSLGGHIALLYALKYQSEIKSLVLTGSSGLFESSLGDNYPRRSDYDYVKQKAEYTFYDPKTASKELVDNIFEMVNNRSKVLRILSFAKSAIRNNLKLDLPQILIPVCLIWGKQDHITPYFVGEDFERLLPNAKLYSIDLCGHAPMMERPLEFNNIVESYLEKLK